MLKLIWENSYGLLVDDGSLAAGALIILAVTWALNGLVGGERVHELSGYLYVALVSLLILINLYAAGRNAARKRQTG
jgi:hypothetical protein